MLIMHGRGFGALLTDTDTHTHTYLPAYLPTCMPTYINTYTHTITFFASRPHEQYITLHYIHSIALHCSALHCTAYTQEVCGGRSIRNCLSENGQSTAKTKDQMHENGAGAWGKFDKFQPCTEGAEAGADRGLSTN